MKNRARHSSGTTFTTLITQHSQLITSGIFGFVALNPRENKAAISVKNHLYHTDSDFFVNPAHFALLALSTYSKALFDTKC